jgi:cytosine/adenosine deaminase-related metal-dependent hydrolase
MRGSNVSLVWSPRSNLALYGRTLDAAHVLDNGISVALGSDWSVSGSYNLISEIRCAAMAAAAFGERPLSGEELWRMVTSGPAAALGLSNATGAIVQGYAADFVIIDDSDGTNIAALATLTEAAVIAVVVEGRLAAGNRDALSGELAPACMRFANRFVCPYPTAPVDVPEMWRVNRGHVDVISLTRETPCLAPAPAD